MFWVNRRRKLIDENKELQKKTAELTKELCEYRSIVNNINSILRHNNDVPECLDVATDDLYRTLDMPITSQIDLKVIKRKLNNAAELLTKNPITCRIVNARGNSSILTSYGNANVIMYNLRPLSNIQVMSGLYAIKLANSGEIVEAYRELLNTISDYGTGNFSTVTKFITTSEYALYLAIISTIQSKLEEDTNADTKQHEES